MKSNLKGRAVHKDITHVQWKLQVQVKKQQNQTY